MPRYPYRDCKDTGCCLSPSSSSSSSTLLGLPHVQVAPSGQDCQALARCLTWEAAFAHEPVISTNTLARLFPARDITWAYLPGLPSPSLTGLCALPPLLKSSLGHRRVGRAFASCQGLRAAVPSSPGRANTCCSRPKGKGAPLVLVTAETRLWDVFYSRDGQHSAFFPFGKKNRLS